MFRTTHNRDNLRWLLSLFWIATVSVLLLVIGSVAYLFSFYNFSKVTYTDADCIVVFGAAVLPGGVPSDALSDRVNEAIDIYKNYGPRCLIFSGAASVYGKHEVDAMLDMTHDRGVDFSDIKSDYNGVNTRKTIDNLDPNRSYIFVSNDFHLARIRLLAKQAGIHRYYVVSSPYIHGRYTRETFLIIREIGAFWYYVFM